MKGGITGLVFDIKRYAIHDGPGIRSTAFLKGCPLDCLWCHNPEGKDPRPVLSFVEARCLSCGACAAACPEGAIDFSPGSFPKTNRERCTACGACAAACPTGAREIIGRRYTPQGLIEELLQDRPFFEASGGGITFSGGEPLAQPEFLRECLILARKKGLHVALDTSGYAEPRLFLELARLSHLVLYDLKDMDEERHRKNTGVPLAPIMKNLQSLFEEGIPVWIRIPVIPGMNDGPETIRAYVDFLSRLPTKPPVFLLPYHDIGKEKYRRLGVPSRLDGLKPPSRARMEELARAFSKAGLEVHIGG
ncbi:MAG: Glycyl-radical enzyme activating protein family [Acetothermia bacterium 64_32]|nr:MAG: Glycyl-radical enzyme activating protein family [Acetothermia bacterium 64_32]HAF71147.1 glycyl-radical enzyme activating protein [Candidatus Acetothermia bacterium]